MMRIDDVRPVPPNQPAGINRRAALAGKPGSAAESVAVGNSQDTSQRAERIDALKKMFSTGQPIDVNKLADKLVESGIFFNEKA